MRERNITSLEEEGLEERLEFLRADCSEHVCKTQTISSVKKETKRDSTFVSVMTRTYNVVRVDKFSIEGGNVPLRLLVDTSLHKDIRSLKHPIETVTVYKTINKKHTD